MKKRNIILAVLFVVIAGGLIFYILYGGTSTEEADQVESTVSEVDSASSTSEIIISQESFSNFSAALTSAGLMAKVDEQTTVFVPNNEAFNSLPEGDKITDSLNEDITGYHVVRGVFNAADLTDGKKLPTISGQELVVSLQDEELVILDAKGNVASIISADLTTASGVIHEIDRVLITQ